MDHDEPTGWPEDGYDGDDIGADVDGGEFSGVGSDDFDDGGPGDEATDTTDDIGDDLGALSVDGEPAEDFASYLDTGPEVTDDPPAPGPDVPPDPHDPVPGTDPDRHWLTDDPAWAVDPFPPALDFSQPPEPVDGWPWSDPALLGDADVPQAPDIADRPSPPVSDLYAYDAAEPQPGEDPWTSLAGSDDPATSSLARFWTPRG